MHVKTGKPVQNVRRFNKFDPVELDILAGGKMTKSAVEIARNPRQPAHLMAGQYPVRNGDAQHIGVQLQIQTVLQAQRLEFILGKVAAKTAFNLIAKLRRTHGNKLPVKGIIMID